MKYIVILKFPTVYNHQLKLIHFDEFNSQIVFSVQPYLTISKSVSVISDKQITLLEAMLIDDPLIHSFRYLEVGEM